MCQTGAWVFSNFTSPKPNFVLIIFMPESGQHFMKIFLNPPNSSSVSLQTPSSSRSYFCIHRLSLSTYCVSGGTAVTLFSNMNFFEAQKSKVTCPKL